MSFCHWPYDPPIIEDIIKNLISPYYNAREMIYSGYPNFNSGIEELSLVSKNTQALVKVNSSDCLYQGLGEYEPHQTEKET